jgi:hypothetical protein
MTATTTRRSLFEVFIGEPLALATAQPHQVLLSTGSVAIMAQFAAHSGIVDPLVGYCIAAGALLGDVPPGGAGRCACGGRG